MKPYPPAVRVRVLELAEYGDWTNAEIAAELGISPDTVGRFIREGQPSVDLCPTCDLPLPHKGSCRRFDRETIFEMNGTHAKGRPA